MAVAQHVRELFRQCEFLEDETTHVIDFVSFQLQWMAVQAYGSGFWHWHCARPIKKPVTVIQKTIVSILIHVMQPNWPRAQARKLILQ
jgi:hypothetical protein